MEVGDKVNLICSSPNASVIWFKGDEPFKSFDRDIKVQKQRIRFREVYPGDSAVYSCQIGDNQERRSVKLQVVMPEFNEEYPEDADYFDDVGPAEEAMRPDAETNELELSDLRGEDYDFILYTNFDVQFFFKTLYFFLKI